MEQRYSLPLRSSPDARTSQQPQTWQTSAHPTYTTGSPQQQQHYYQAILPHTSSTGFRFQSIPLLLGDSSQHGQYLQSPPPTVPSKGHPTYPPIPPFSATLAPLPPSPFSRNNAQLLPIPSHILRSQDPPVQGPCLACGQRNCHLTSHLYFSRQVLQKHNRQQENAGLSELTPRPSNATLLPMQLMTPIVVQETEREHLLSLWTQDWSPIRLGPERHLFPTKFIDRILPAAKRHGPLLQAVLAYAGALWASANDMLGELASRQQTVAVEVLSQACPSEQEASSDEAMMAATLLLLVYMEQGNDFEVSKHIAGLEHLVKLRGGVYYLGMGGVLAETLLHADHMQAIFFNQSPVWRVVVPAMDDIGFASRTGNGFRKQQVDSSMDPQIILAARSVCKVADILDCAGGVGLPNKVQHAFGYLSMMATYQLAQCNAVHHGSASVNECVGLALILFHHVALCTDGSISPGSVRIEYRFWTALQEAEQKGVLIGISPCLYMWIVTMGLTVAIRRESSYRMLAVEKLRAARIPAGIQRWDQFKTSVLDDFGWLASAQEETFRRIWKEVEGVPGMKMNGH